MVDGSVGRHGQAFGARGPQQGDPGGAGQAAQVQACSGGALQGEQGVKGQDFGLFRNAGQAQPGRVGAGRHHAAGGQPGILGTQPQGGAQVGRVLHGAPQQGAARQGRVAQGDAGATLVSRPAMADSRPAASSMGPRRRLRGMPGPSGASAGSTRRTTPLDRAARPSRRGSAPSCAARSVRPGKTASPPASITRSAWKPAGAWPRAMMRPSARKKIRDLVTPVERVQMAGRADMDSHGAPATSWRNTAMDAACKPRPSGGPRRSTPGAAAPSVQRRA